MKLTPKQEAFVDFYIDTGNASEAARLAGYSLKTAHRIGQENLQKPAIQAAIEARQAEIHSERTATIEEVMEYLTAVMRGEIQEQVVVMEGMGEGMSRPTLVDKPPSINDRTKAADQILKRFGRSPRLDAKEQEIRIKKLQAEAEALIAMKNHTEQSIGMMQLVDSIKIAQKKREESDE